MLSEKLIFSLLKNNPLFSRLKDNNRKEWGYFHTIELYDLLSVLDRLETKSLIDLGCGTGLLLAQIRCERPYIYVRGIDNEPSLLEPGYDLADIKLGNILGITKEELADCDTIYTWCPFIDTDTTKMFVDVLHKAMNGQQKIVCLKNGNVPLNEILIESKLFKLEDITSESFQVFSKI